MFNMKKIIYLLALIFINSKLKKSKTKEWVCYNWTEADSAAGAGKGNIDIDRAVCTTRGFNFTQGDGTCGTCGCCQWK